MKALTSHHDVTERGTPLTVRTAKFRLPVGPPSHLLGAQVNSFQEKGRRLPMGDLDQPEVLRFSAPIPCGRFHPWRRSFKLTLRGGVLRRERTTAGFGGRQLAA